MYYEKTSRDKRERDWKLKNLFGINVFEKRDKNKPSVNDYITQDIIATNIGINHKKKYSDTSDGKIEQTIYFLIHNFKWYKKR